MQRDETSDVKPFEGIEDDESWGTRESAGYNPSLSECIWRGNTYSYTLRCIGKKIIIAHTMEYMSLMSDSRGTRSYELILDTSEGVGLTGRSKQQWKQ